MGLDTYLVVEEAGSQSSLHLRGLEEEHSLHRLQLRVSDDSGINWLDYAHELPLSIAKS